MQALTNLDKAIKSRQLTGWDGIAYDVEEGDSGLALAFADSFAIAKAHGLAVLVSVSHSQPYGVSDANALMISFFTDSNIDFISPKLYTTGQEIDNDYVAIGTLWRDFTLAKAKIVPTVVLGSRDFPKAKTFFSQYGINLYGFIQWTQNGIYLFLKMFIKGYFAHRIEF
jgi:hypothetical protein